MKNRKKQNQNQKLTVPERFGNYRDEQAWSLEAKRQRNSANTSFFLEKVDADGLAIQNEMSKYFSSGVSSRWLADLGFKLIQDIYRLGVLPYPLGDSLVKSNSMLRAFGTDLGEIMENFGDYGILFSDSRQPFEGWMYKDAIQVESDLLLTPRRIGMPVKHFLLWYKGCNAKRDVMREWTGIPIGQQQYVYEHLLELFREHLENEHRAEAKYSRPVFVSTGGDVNVNCTNANVFNF